MKSGSKPLIVLVIFLSITGAVLILSYVSIKLKCEEITMQKVIAEEKLNSKNNLRVNLIAQEQFYSSKERISEIAELELGMVRKPSQNLSISVLKEKIDEIKEVLKEKYE